MYDDNKTPTIMFVCIIIFAILYYFYNPKLIQRREWNSKFYGCAQNHLYRSDCNIILRNSTYVKDGYIGVVVTKH